MANQGASLTAGAENAPPAADAAAPDPRLQRLVDEAAGFNLFAVPGRGMGGAVAAAGGRGGAIGLRLTEALHRFQIDLGWPAGSGVCASNAVGEAVGRLDLRWMVIPHDFRAQPGVEPPATALDRTRSQRFAMQEATFTFDGGRDGFRSFGTGRTFPFRVGDRLKLGCAAVGDITEGWGGFNGHEGNFTLCGEITPEHAFVGHLLVRVQDPQGALRGTADLPPLGAGPDPDPEVTYVLFAGQKVPGQVNRFSLDADGQVRGLNIPTELKRLDLGSISCGPGGFRGRDFRVGEGIGQEIGFGRGSEPGADPVGTGLRPFLFEGVARYSFHDRTGRDVGALTTNVLEGRRFDMRLPGAPEEVAWRFGFFGPVVLGSGCFRGAQGMFYGASGSILKPPPGPHMITHFYAARLFDPQGRLRSARGRS